MHRERLFLYDTTLRDGQQTQGVQFSTAEKIRIAEALSSLGIDHIEGGWPGANPTDSEFFAQAPSLNATLTAFGMTKRAGRSAENDDVLAGVMNAGTASVCLVGKSHDFHVTDALGISLEDNLENIHASMAHIVAQGREAILDAEHFFDGYRANPGYAVDCLKAALDAGARWVVLCDTNGGALPMTVGQVVRDVIAAGVPGDRLGIHTHDDTGNAVANTLVAIEAGARQIQGTLNGLGERCGNANLVTLIPTLLLKDPFASRFETNVPLDALKNLRSLSLMLDEILNRLPLKQAPYVGASAFAHKAGLHASAIVKNPATYEHIDPEIVGNERVIPMSNQAGQSNLRKRLEDAGIETKKDDAALPLILDRIKERESLGYAYDSAQASFELLAREELGLLPHFFEVERYRVISERRRNARGKLVVESEAVVTVQVAGKSHTSFFKNDHANDLEDDGPVNALWQAIKTDLGRHQSVIDVIRLVDFKVRITGSGTEAATRVIIDFQDDAARRWSTVGVSANIVDAAFEALCDGIVWKLIQAGARA